MSLYVFAFLALVGLFLLCAVIVDVVRFGQKDKSDDYVIPHGWKSEIYNESTEGKQEELHLTTDGNGGRSEETTDWRNYDPHHQPPPRKLRWSAWFAIFFLIPYLLCLFYLAHWVQWEDEKESELDSRMHHDESLISDLEFAGVIST